MNRLLHKFALLPFRDKWFLLRLAMLIMILRIFVKLVPFPQLYALTRRLWPKPSLYNYTSNLAYTQRMVWSVMRVGNHLLRRRCLAEALAIHILLSKKRIAHQLRIGFTRSRQGFVAHAWVEADGIILTNEDQNLRFYFTIPTKQLAPLQGFESNQPSRSR